MSNSSSKLRRLAVLASVVAVALTATGTAAAEPRHQSGSPGAPSVGDPLFPGLGNGGYDVRHTTLNLRYPTAEPLQTVQGLAVIEARATQNLSRFNLDFAGDSVGRVFVDGRAAESSWQGEELVITPQQAIRNHRRFTVAVPYTSSTTPEDPTTLITPWFATPSGSFTAFQPNYAHTKFPINDHPSDKSTYTLRFDVPTARRRSATGSRPTAGPRAAGRSPPTRSAIRWRASSSRSTPAR